MLNSHKHILVYITSSVSIFGLFWICIFGDWHTVKAFGDDSYIYLVDFDETAYDMYVQGYYPTDYTYSDFRRDSIEGMVSHYVATDNNNFGSVVDTVENAVINDGWSAIKDFFVNAWIDLKSGVVTVEEGFTDDFKHSLDGRFKITPSPSGGTVIINGHTWYSTPYTDTNGYYTTGSTTNTGSGSADVTVYYSLYKVGTRYYDVWCTWSTQVCYLASRITSSYTQFSIINGTYSYNGATYYCSNTTMSYRPTNSVVDYYSSYDEARADFYGNFEAPQTEPYWSGDGYYSNTPTNYSINLPALPAIDWQSISNNNKTKYGVDFPDVNVSVDFQLPDMYYPRTVTYDVPYWLQNGDETSVDWVNVNFDDVTMPSVDLPDGDGTFFQNIFLALPVGFSALILGAMLCYLIFLLL